MKAGHCKYYNGLGMNRDLSTKTCDAGIVYLQVARPLTDKERAWHNANYPELNESSTAILKRIPCFAENGLQANCSQFCEPTEKELEDQENEWKKRFTDMMIVRKTITDYIQINNLPRGCSGKLSCPICNQGEVLWSRASFNLHIHARCTTPGCVHWME